MQQLRRQPVVNFAFFGSNCAEYNAVWELLCNLENLPVFESFCIFAISNNLYYRVSILPILEVIPSITKKVGKEIKERKNSWKKVVGDVIITSSQILNLLVHI